MSQEPEVRWELWKGHVFYPSTAINDKSKGLKVNGDCIKGFDMQMYHLMEQFGIS